MQELGFWTLGGVCLLFGAVLFLFIYVCLYYSEPTITSVSTVPTVLAVREMIPTLENQIDRVTTTESEIFGNTGEKVIFITSYMNPTDAGGSTLQRIVSAYAVSKRLQDLYRDNIIDFVYTDNPILEKNTGLMSSEDWTKAWNEMLRFPKVHREIDPRFIHVQVESMAELQQFIENDMKSQPHKSMFCYNISNGKKLVDNDISILEAVRDDVRQFYYANSDIPFVSFDGDRIHVAVHVRIIAQGDIDLDPIRKYFGAGNAQNDGYFFEHMGQIRNHLQNMPLAFHIYSEGECAKLMEFSSFENENTAVIFHLNENPFQTFREMVKADILIAANSSYSYLAHILRTGPTIRHETSQHKWPAQAFTKLDNDVYEKIRQFWV